MIATILDKAISGRRLDAREGLVLLESHDLAALGGAADALARRLHPEPFRTYNIDRNINYTNVCQSRCRFCAFWRAPDAPDAYVLSTEEVLRKVGELVDAGGTQVLMQGGLNPALDLAWTESLLRAIREAYPMVDIHSLSPPEVVHLARLEGLPVRTVLARLRDAGLSSLPGGGAEVLSDRVAIIDSGRFIAMGTPGDIIREHGTGDIVVVRGGGRSAYDQLLGISSQVEQVGNDVVVRVDRRQVLPEVVMRLERNGTYYEEMQLRRSSLEDVFLSLTGRRLGESGEVE